MSKVIGLKLTDHDKKLVEQIENSGLSNSELIRKSLNFYFQSVNQPVNHVHKEEISYEVNSVNQPVNHKQQEETTETVNQVNQPVNHDIQVAENYNYDIWEYLRCDNKTLWNRAELIFERMDTKPEKERHEISWYRM